MVISCNQLLIAIFVVFAVILIIYFLYTLFSISESREEMINIDQINDVSWTRNTCPYAMNETLTKVLDNNKLKYENKEQGEWKLYFPCSYDNIEEEINEIKLLDSNDQRFFIINNADFLIGKDYLWSYILNYHGIEKAQTLMPMTYILYIDSEIEKIKNEFDTQKLYILKKNIQRQEGLKITNSLQEILDAKNEQYVVAQELLQDPYLIDGRKINMRFYILVICKDNDMDVYIFNNGFMYYTKDLFKKNTIDFGPNITTGYVDRWIYDVNPLTHEDFKIYLDNEDRNISQNERILKDQGHKLSEIMFTRINILLREIFVSFIGKICGGKLKDYISFQLFGADIAIDENLYPKIMEINKGPDMGAKDDRDGMIKYKCMEDMLQIIGALPKNHDNGFIKILDYEK